MSAWDRLPAEYRRLCETIAQRAGHISPRNRRVRYAADLWLADRRIASRRVSA